MSDVSLFDQLPHNFQDAVTGIVEQCYGDGLTRMARAFREWQAEIYLAGTDGMDKTPDHKTLETEALAFRAGWEWRDQDREGSLV